MKEQNKILTLKHYPFSVIFTWKENQIKVELNNGEDILKLAKLFSNFLTNNDIPNTLFEDYKNF